jgi:hypothetical protein
MFLCKALKLLHLSRLRNSVLLFEPVLDTVASVRRLLYDDNNKMLRKRFKPVTGARNVTVNNLYIFLTVHLVMILGK